ncbi:MAG TPA: hypothetical protein DHU69_03810, partial [Deltaproteobacteria bacterium]|nr:hypothetical protein [Deltaproteobacteria bacterium]
MINHLKMPFIISLLFHGAILTSIAVFYKPAHEALMDVTPLEFIHLQEEEPSVKAEKEAHQKVVLPKEIKATPPPPKVEEGIKEDIEEIATAPAIEQAREELLPPAEHAEHAHPIEPQPDAAIEAQKEIAEAVSIKSEANDTVGEINRFKTLVRTKIEQAKFYPKWARDRGYEGVVGVSFVIKPDGNVIGIKVVRPCHCEVLNKAACEAIMKAAPFHPRPKDVEDGEMAME